MSKIRLTVSDSEAVTVLIAATFAFKADELDTFIDPSDVMHIQTWNKFIDHAHMFIEHLTLNGFVKKVTEQ